MKRNHHSLISLLLTFQHGDRYHLVFPWADGNLRDFWRTIYPKAESPARDWSFSKWGIEQCLDIADGLAAIHKGLSGSNYTWSSSQVYGRHGDLKPENILWFRYRSKAGETNHQQNLGHFVISDFGVTDFHRSRTKDRVDTKTIRAFSPTYSAPECEVHEKIGQKYDIWALGCILLECVEWHIGGWDAVDKFSKRRANERGKGAQSLMPEDTFYCWRYSFEKKSQDTTPEKIATLKKTVQDVSTMAISPKLRLVNNELTRKLGI